MPKKTVVVPTQKILNSLKTAGNYTRNPYGIAVIGSISLHLVAAVALPGWSESEENTETGNQEVVRVVDLPAEVQSRLPSLSPSIDLSVFENNPDFNLDMSAIGNGTIPGGNGLNGLTGIDGNGYVFLPGTTGNLPTPFAPSLGRVNYSFVPNSPPAIASRFIAPPPPSFNSSSGFLPPPPGVPAFSGSGNIFNVPINPNNSNASIAPAPGNQQVFSINTQPRNSNNTNNDLIQRQRQLENEAAIALSPSTFAPGNPDIRFNADLLQPSDLKNPASLLPRPQAQPTPTNTPQTVVRNSGTISRSIRGNYPKSACSSQASGTATYNVVVTPSGTPSQWSLSSSSGNNSLDNQASQDIRNTSFDGANSNYRVSVGYTYQPSFCAAFKPQSPAPTAPKPPANPTPQPTSPAPLVIEVPESKPTPPPSTPAPTPTAPTSPPKPTTPVAPAPNPPATVAPPAAPATPPPEPSPTSTAE
ncbi:MAG: TonB family protein [Limnothrix sp. RL_2_0]|nr:TonB family protein [Limnothrix sp. RL_2_0]